MRKGKKSKTRDEGYEPLPPWYDGAPGLFKPVKLLGIPANLSVLLWVLAAAVGLVIGRFVALRMVAWWQGRRRARLGGAAATVTSKLPVPAVKTLASKLPVPAVKSLASKLPVPTVKSLASKLPVPTVKSLASKLPVPAVTSLASKLPATA